MRRIRFPRLLTRLDMYIIKKYLGTYFFTITLLISIAVVFDFNEHVDQFVEYNAPANEIIFDYYLNFVPYYSNLFSQLFVFVSVILFTVKLADNTEIVAMMSSGVTTMRLLRPYLVSACVISLLTLYLGAYVIPIGNVKRVRFENTYRGRERVTSATNVQLQVADGVVAYIGRYENYNKTGYDFTLDKFENKKLISHLQATMAEYDSLSEEPGHWIVKNWQERNLKGMKEVVRSGGRLDTLLNMQPEDFLITRDQQTTLTTPELKEYIDRQRERGFANIQSFEVEYHQRYSASFAAIILTVIGFSLSAKKRKNGMGISLGVGLALSCLYIVFQRISSTFAYKANMDAALSAWIPNIVFFFIAWYCLRFAPK
ncbi:MAG: LptF/LptG family permease [Bacteroidaceae bacterium]|nr:LptF/LptG family permease [Bacteroidaceae bacterium]